MSLQYATTWILYVKCHLLTLNRKITTWGNISNHVCCPITIQQSMLFVWNCYFCRKGSGYMLAKTNKNYNVLRNVGCTCTHSRNSLKDSSNFNFTELINKVFLELLTKILQFFIVLSSISFTLSSRN